MESTGVKVYQPLCKSKLIITLGLLKSKVFPKEVPIHYSQLLPTYEKCICILKDIHKFSTRDKVISFGRACLDSILFNIQITKNNSESYKEFLPTTESEIKDLHKSLLLMLDKIRLFLYRWNIRNEISEY
jgi:hypothetical protein